MLELIFVAVVGFGFLTACAELRLVMGRYGMSWLAGLVVLTGCDEPPAANAAQAPPSIAAEPPPPVSPWSVDERVSPISDRSDRFIWKRAMVDPANPEAGDRASGPRLAVGCRDGDFVVAVGDNGYLGIDPVRVVFRVDRAEPEEVTLRVSSDGSAFGWYWLHESLDVMKRLASAERFAVRVEAPHSARREIAFNLDGFRDEIPALGKACGLRLAAAVGL